jgi:hypothetical protein
MAALALVVLAACGPGADRGDGGGGLRLSFEDRREPGAFQREGVGRRDRPDGAAGLWAVVAGLPRPERATVENLETGAETSVALFAGGGNPADIRLSAEAADALGIGDRPVRIRVTALRREPQLAVPDDGF